MKTDSMTLTRFLPRGAVWHRREGARTACGIPIDRDHAQMQGSGTPREVRRGYVPSLEPLCPMCF